MARILINWERKISGNDSEIISLKEINHTAQGKAKRHPGAMNTPTCHNALKGHYQMKCGINKHELPLIIHKLGHELVLIET